LATVDARASDCDDSAMLHKTDFSAVDHARQCRRGPLTPWEKALGDALEAIFATGESDLPAIVAALNERRAFDIDGRPWTEASFRAAMAELGA
jgi:hypothetical protein